MGQGAAPLTLDIASRFGYESPNSSVHGLKDILLQLQGLRISFVDGGAQSTAISAKTKGGVTGSAAKINTGDTLFGAVEFKVVAASGLADISLRSDCRCISTGNVQFSAAATTNSKILVFWFDKTGYVANA